MKKKPGWFEMVTARIAGVSVIAASVALMILPGEKHPIEAGVGLVFGCHLIHNGRWSLI